MKVQYISDSNGNLTNVIIPIDQWNVIKIVFWGRKNEEHIYTLSKAQEQAVHIALNELEEGRGFLMKKWWRKRDSAFLNISNLKMKIVWTPAAQDDYWNNISFLKRKWSEKEVEAFMNKTESILQTLTSGNVSYTSATNLLNVHKIPIVKQVILFIW